MTDLARTPTTPAAGSAALPGAAGNTPTAQAADDRIVLAMPVAAIAAAAWAAALGLVLIGVPVLIGWAVAAHGTTSVPQALEAAGLGWLIAHRAPVSVPGGALAVLPLGLMLVPLWLTAKAGGWAARAARVRGRLDAALLVAGGSLAYGLIAALVAGAASTGSVAVVPLQALVAATLVCAVGMGVGVVRAAGLGAAVAAGVPARVRDVLRAGTAAALALLAAGAALAAVALVLHLHDAVAVHRALAPGAVGGLLLALLGVAYAPVAAIWAGAFASGAGVVVGAGSLYGPFAVQTGPVPALPWLAALPEAAPRWGPALLVLPVLAGAVGAVVLLHRLPETTTTVLLGELAGVAAVGGALWSAAAALASGPAGPGRLAESGPTWWMTGVVLMGEMLVGVLLVVAADTVRMRFHSGSDTA